MNNKMEKTHSILLISIMIFSFFTLMRCHVSAITLAVLEDQIYSVHDGKPDITDSRLKLEEVASNLELPTNIAFLGLDDILVLEKDTGIVKRIVGGEELEEPVLDVNVANSRERGMLGIAVAKNSSSIDVFLYFTESRENNDGADNCYKNPDRSIDCKYENEPLGNRL